MMRRLQILLTDAFFLAAIGVLAFTLFRVFQQMEPEVEGEAALASASLDVSPVSQADVPLGLGEAMVGAWVRIEASDQLILPGDEVTVGIPSRGAERLGPFKVAAIDTAGAEAGGQAFLNMTGDRDLIATVRKARQTDLLTARAHRARIMSETLDQPRLRNDQIITRRFRDAPWSRRVAAE